MQNPIWQKALRSCADPARVRQYLDQLGSTNAAEFLQKASPEQARVLTAVLSGSRVLSEQLIHEPELLPRLLEPDSLRLPRQEQGLRREVGVWLQPSLIAGDYAVALSSLRRFKRREMLRVAARDLARLGTLSEIIMEISVIAGVCIDAVFQICQQQLVQRFGHPYHRNATGQWEPTRFCVFGLGKLGGQELNYSSDVDVIFLYSEEGQVFKTAPTRSRPVGRGLANHQWFKRLAEAIIAELTRMTPEGTLFRVDVRLRPEGDAGPLVRSLASYENYYAQWGQVWERMMLIKARRVAGDSELAGEFLEMIQPFRYPRSLGEGTLREVAAMKRRIENEVVRAGEIHRNVKLGRGGIREIEFAVQTLQLLNAGRTPFLQCHQTLPALEKLVQYRLMLPGSAKKLKEAYCFLRDLEHRLQMEQNLQTHTIPTDAQARARLAALMGFKKVARFDAWLKSHTDNVHQIYRKLFKLEAPANDILPREFDETEADWKKILGDHSFRDVDQAFRLIKEFVLGPGYVHVSQRTVDLAFQLLPRLLALCPARTSEARKKIRGTRREPARARERDHVILSDPDRVITRLDSFVAAYGARPLLYETWVANPTLFDLLLLLFDRSEYLAEIAIRTPDLVDELQLSGQLRRRKNADEMLADLRHGLSDQDQRLWLRRYVQVELLRLGLRDILGLVDFEQNLAELSGLADACLRYSLEVLMRNHRLRRPPFVVIGLGKLGGQELTYGSDLDIVFVTDCEVSEISKLQRLAVEFMDLLATQTEMGIAFAIDARLRPDGEKGLLVNTLDAYEEYYRRRAGLWEIQALTRTRPIAGNLDLGQSFQALAATLTDFTPAGVACGFAVRPAETGGERRHRAKSHETPAGAMTGLAAYVPNWKQVIAKMRERIEKERTPVGKQDLAIKTGAGGLVDAEFAAQVLCLANGWHEPNTLRALLRARDQKALPAAGADLLIEHYRKLLRIEGILRRWSFEGETLLPDSPAPLYRVAVRCGIGDTETFMRAVREARAAIRTVYTKVMAGN